MCIRDSLRSAHEAQQGWNKQKGEHRAENAHAKCQRDGRLDGDRNLFFFFAAIILGNDDACTGGHAGKKTDKGIDLSLIHI